MKKNLKKHTQLAVSVFGAIFLVSIMILIPIYFLTEGRFKLFYSTRYGQISPGIAIGYSAIALDILFLGLAAFIGFQWLKNRRKFTTRKR